MDSNKDDARRCLQLAEAALADNNLPRAKRLVEKSIRMYPLPDLQQPLLRSINENQKPANSPSSKPTTTATSKPSTSENKPRDEPAPPPREPSQRMLDAVATVNNKARKSHYEVLGLQRQCTQDEIKKSYRKLALQLHPDRNFAPGADEAFKRVGRAFMTLSDPAKRKYYDQTGADEPGQHPAHQAGGNGIRRRRAGPTTFTTHQFGNGFANVNEMNAEELFEFLFNSSFDGPTHVYRRRERRPPPQEVEDLPFWERIRPALFIFIFVFVAFILPEMAASPQYSLHQSYYYSQRATTKNDSPYFLPRNSKLSTHQRKQLERNVDNSVYRMYHEKCSEEIAYSRDMRRRSQGWFISRQRKQYYLDEYRRATRPSCERYKALKGALNR